MYTPSQEMRVNTPIGVVRVWCPESHPGSTPVIYIDYMHEEGDIPLSSVKYNDKKHEICTSVYGDMYSDDPTVVAHKNLDLL